jgi:hypothetical protein
VGGDNGSGGWLALSKAAQIEGISLDAMRRRVRRGEYQRRQVRTRHGLAWQVRLSADAQGDTHGEPRIAPTVDGDAPTVAPTDEPTVAPTVDRGTLTDGALVTYLRGRDEQLARLQDELLARSEAAATWQARAEMLAAQLAQAQNTIRALEAPVRDALGRASDGLGTETIQKSSEAAKRPWWRFW